MKTVRVYVIKGSEQIGKYVGEVDAYSNGDTFTVYMSSNEEDGDMIPIAVYSSSMFAFSVVSALEESA